ncbi:MAG: selenide, water dikinase SelD, partial [Acidobacteria bacterium]
PVVDQATDWGRIAAANALSDIYAMGATPLTALQYLGWPRDVLPFDLASEVIAGGMDVMEEASCTVVGGHSIDSPEPTYGFAVTGVAGSDRLIANNGGQPDDVLILTKPLGMGVLTTAIKRGKCPPELALKAIEVMATLNAVAGAALHEHNAHAATDVTGFGLLGHLREMCVASNVGAEIEFDRVPILEGVADLLARGMWAGGSQRNLESLRPDVDSSVDDDPLRLLVDAQTSGGLLVALPADSADGYLHSVPRSAVVGRLTSEKAIKVT